MPALPHTSSYRVGAGWPIWFMCFSLVAVGAFLAFAIAVLEREGLSCGALFAAGLIVLGLFIFRFAARRAEISNTDITIRMIFRSITIRWDELAHIHRSDAWLILKDVHERSWRLGPYPRHANDFERDVRVRRPHAISPVPVLHSDSSFAGFSENERLTARQAVGVALYVILIVFGSIAARNLDDFIGPLLKWGLSRLTAYGIAASALALFMVLGVLITRWLTGRSTRARG